MTERQSDHHFQTNYNSGLKDNLSTDFKTHRKKQLSFASPIRKRLSQQYDNDQFKSQYSKNKNRSPLRNQELQDYNRVKTQLKRGIQIAKENISLSMLNQQQKLYGNEKGQYVPLEEFSALHEEHKYEVDRLLLEIDSLHANIHEIQKSKVSDINRVTEELKKENYIELSKLKQAHATQVDDLETQLRKVKEQFAQQTSQFENLKKKSEREAKNLQSVHHRLGEEMKMTIQKKNDQIAQIEASSENALANAQKQSQANINSMRDLWDRELKKLQKKIERQQQQKEQIVSNGDQVLKENEKLCDLIEHERLEANQLLQELIQKESERYDALKCGLDRQFSSSFEGLQREVEFKEEIYKSELLRLKNFIQKKKQDDERASSVQKERIKSLKQDWERVHQENQELKMELKIVQQQHMQELQVSKVRMAALHENDISQLVKLYESKIDDLGSRLRDKEEEDSRLRKNLYDETNRRWELKKKYDIEFSKLNAKVIKMRSGISAMEIDMKQKLENERSMMLLTSRSIIKDVESKAEYNKFHEEELRKLRQLFDLQEKEVKESNVQVEEKIRTAEEELSRLSRKIVEEKNKGKEAEAEHQEALERKEKEVFDLRAELSSIQHPEFDNSKELALIEELKREIHEKNDLTNKQRDQISKLERDIALMKAEIDQYEIENQITQEEAKKQFREISEANMNEFKGFYEAKLRELEQDKAELRLQLENKDDKVTELVRKYRELENAMKDTVKKIKKKGELEKRVIQMGMDNNLVKNMQEIVRVFSSDKESQ